MRRAYVHLFGAVSVLLLVSGCATTVPLQSSFWEQRKGARVGVAMTTLPEAHAHRVGSEMLLDMAINKSLSEKLDARMKQVAPTMLDTVTDNFVEQLEKLGFDAKDIDENIPLEAFPKSTAKSSGNVKYFERDVSALAQKHDIDLLLLITVFRYGTLREYYGFIPLGSPKALFDVRGQMIDLKNSQLLWQTYLTDDEATVGVTGEWSQPPDYPNLVAALEQAINKSMAQLETKFFATAR